MSGESVSGDQVRVNILKGRIRYYTETDDDVPAGLVGELEDELDALLTRAESAERERDALRAEVEALRAAPSWERSYDWEGIRATAERELEAIKAQATLREERLDWA